MADILPLIPYLKSISDKSNDVNDEWSSLSCKGDFNSDIFLAIENLFTALDASLQSLVECYIDSDKVSNTDLSLYKGKTGFKSFKITFNKHALLEKNKNDAINSSFFLNPNDCSVWFKNIDFLNEKCPVYVYEPLCIYVDGLTEVIGNNKFYFSPLQDKKDIPEALLVLPRLSQIKENVHFITNHSIYLAPQSFYIPLEVKKDLISDTFIYYSCIILSCCTLNEFYSKDKVVIDGIRRISSKLYSQDDNCSFDFYLNLIRIISWIYEDKPSIRRKLFNDRLTLDFDDSASLISNLHDFGVNALSQAKERYIFVITERKDAYVKELKELLKDLRGQSDLYSQKIRTLLNNFLRDLLASIVLVGFTIFTKFSDSINLDKNKLLEYVFILLGVYYLISIAFQIIVDSIDINITSRELRYWKNASNELLPEREFEKHFNTSLRPRRRSIYWIYPIISLMYILIALSCFYYPKVLNSLSIKLEKSVPKQDKKPLLDQKNNKKH